MKTSDNIRIGTKRGYTRQRNFIFLIPLLLVASSLAAQLTALRAPVNNNKVSDYGHENIILKGLIKHYPSQLVRLYTFNDGSIILTDSALTDESGRFVINSIKPDKLYKADLDKGQFFIFFSDGKPMEIETLYSPNPFNNAAFSNLKTTSAINNKYMEWQNILERLVIAEQMLVKVMRLYPLTDPFHSRIEQEYIERYSTAASFVKTLLKENPNNPLTKMVMAYYLPVLPDWKMPDGDRNAIISKHFFDYFDITDAFYLNSDLLPNKIDEWFTLHSDRKQTLLWTNESYGKAADTLMIKLMPVQHGPVWNFVMNYIFKKFAREHFEMALLYLHDKYLKTGNSDCGPADTTFNWVRERAGVLRDVQPGSIAPDFTIEEGRLNLHQVKSDFTLVLFWASWCSHCTQMLPSVQKEVNALQAKLNGKKLSVIAVSLDTAKAGWQDFIRKGNYSGWKHTSELKGWNGTVPAQYNVFATPTMYLLDKDKKIIGKPMTTWELGDIVEAEIKK